MGVSNRLKIRNFIDSGKSKLGIRLLSVSNSVNPRESMRNPNQMEKPIKNSLKGTVYLF